jgi:uncharacterized membrane protein YoaK (UPF0700 family)
MSAVRGGSGSEAQREQAHPTVGSRSGGTRLAWVSAVGRGQRPLQLALVILSFVTGLVDAVTYLAFGHIFAANMTGNVIVLGLALVGAGEISATASVVSLCSFIIGAAVSARLAGALHHTRPGWLLTLLSLETGLLALATAACLVPRSVVSDMVVVGLLAVAMGMRIVTVRRLGISDVSTTVVTSTLAGLAADVLLSGAPFRDGGVRLAVVAAMLFGAAAGAVLLGGGAALVLGVAASLVLLVTVSYVAAIQRRTIFD